MSAAKWIKEAQKAGWLVTGSKELVLCLQCSKQGCGNQLEVPLHNLGPVPEPCTEPHVDQFEQAAVTKYQGIVEELQRRRRSLGLSQDDLAAAAGLADGHINKLEAFHRAAQFPTLQLWAETLGLTIALKPTNLPPATARAIEARISAPYNENQARFKNGKSKRLAP